MGKSEKDTEEAAKENNVVTMPRKDCGEETGGERNRRKGGRGEEGEERGRERGKGEQEDGGQETEEGGV
jgi:hypothetical protein